VAPVVVSSTIAVVSTVTYAPVVGTSTVVAGTTTIAPVVASTTTHYAHGTSSVVTVTPTVTYAKGTTVVIIGTTTVPLVTSVAPVLTSTTSVVYTTTSKAPVATIPANPTFEKECKDYCNKIFDSACASVVDTAYYVNSCIADSKLTGNYKFADSLKNAYMAHCNSMTTYMKNDVKPEIKEKSADVVKKCGLGGHSCPANCSAHGDCTENGCVCSAGWGGIDCSLDQSKMITYNGNSILTLETTGTFDGPILSGASVITIAPVFFALAIILL
jgi:hypothetical protein